VNVLALIHGTAVEAGVFGDEVAARGFGLEAWSSASAAPLPRPLEDYGAVLVFGGSMHADQDDRHPWLRDEDALLRRLLELGVPTLGVCLGVQLLAKAAGGAVYPAPAPEIGWFPIELTEAGGRDPLLGLLPQSFHAFQWHYYTYDVPAEAEELARSETCTQAFRLGESAWGIQFHAEITMDEIVEWSEDGEDDPLSEEALEESRQRIGEWNELGRRLCGGFLELAGLALGR
jgi:GMP synthase (glutamine-hydrolysing)